MTDSPGTVPTNPLTGFDVNCDELYLSDPPNTQVIYIQEGSAIEFIASPPSTEGSDGYLVVKNSGTLNLSYITYADPPRRVYSATAVLGTHNLTVSHYLNDVVDSSCTIEFHVVAKAQVVILYSCGYHLDGNNSRPGYPWNLSVILGNGTDEINVARVGECTTGSQLSGQYLYFEDYSDLTLTIISSAIAVGRQETRVFSGTAQYLWPTLFEKWTIGPSGHPSTYYENSVSSISLSPEDFISSSSVHMLLVSFSTLNAMRIIYNVGEYSEREDLDAYIIQNTIDDQLQYLIENLPQYSDETLSVYGWRCGRSWTLDSVGQAAESYDSFLEGLDTEDHEWFEPNTSVIVTDAYRLVRIDPVFSISDSNPTSSILVFNPSGGQFTNESLISEITKTGFCNYDYLKDRWVWYTNAPLSSLMVDKKLELKFSVPYSPTTGLMPPSGIERADGWESSAPYFLSETLPLTEWQTLPDDHTIVYTITGYLPIDSSVKRTLSPHWVPAQRDRQSAILVTTGYGAVDLGHIQSINETYDASLSPIPIVCFGYGRSFCMDLGVTKTISLSVIRTNPMVINEDSEDSRDWSNAHWISYLKTLLDRWQMMTNGSQLYLLRPTSDRLKTGTENDPMRQYYTEITGDRCYVTGLPIDYKDSPHTIAGTITLAIGTLYPQKPEVERVPVAYYQNQNATPVIRYLPSTTLFMLPDPSEVWGPSSSNNIWTESGGSYYVTGSIVTGYSNVPLNGRFFSPKTIQALDEFHILPEDVYAIYAKSTQLDSSNSALVLTNRVITVSPDPQTSAPTVILVTLVGGGGGGGGCGRPVDPETNPMTIPQCTGGGGGASGYKTTLSFVLDKSFSTYNIGFSLGQGGTGGSAGWYEVYYIGHSKAFPRNDSEMNGTDGTPTVVYLGGQGTSSDHVRIVSALGGEKGYGGSINKEGVYGAGGIEGYHKGGNGGTVNSPHGEDGDGESSAPGKKGLGGPPILSSSPTPYFGGGGGGGGGYFETGLNNMGNASNARYSQDLTPGGGVDYSDRPEGDSTVASYGAGGGGGGGSKDHRALEGMFDDAKLWGYRGYDGKDGGRGWAYIIVTNGSIS